MRNQTESGAAGTKPHEAHSQADVLAENEALQVQVKTLTTRATSAEGNIALLTTQRDSGAAQVGTLTKQVGELTAQLTAANNEIAILRPKAEDAGKQAAAIVAGARIVGGHAASPNQNGEKPKTLTEQAVSNRKAAGLKTPTV